MSHDALCKGSMRDLSSAIDPQIFSLINLVNLIIGSIQNRNVTMWVWDPGSII
ncbi:hypothetical protein HanRHA438_Chr07g0304311 [Helianthus annuus]|nr:hypothetical protein HanIR_Chr07g0317081 [Helianthus annuus]KAJ0907894.1 hypothetical protein HanRHA438_Chr07g0304311 [Helianthus annuus]